MGLRPTSYPTGVRLSGLINRRNVPPTRTLAHTAALLARYALQVRGPELFYSMKEKKYLGGSIRLDLNGRLHAPIYGHSTRYQIY
jgi:hypothetical protein